MSFKVVRSGAGVALAWGPNDEQYGPTVPEGCSLAIEDVQPLVVPTKEQRKAAILSVLEDKPTRVQLKTIIQLAELIATLQAPAYGLSVLDAIAYAYSENPTYRRAKDAETACMAIDAELV